MLSKVAAVIKKVSGGATQNNKCTSGSLTAKSMDALFQALGVNLVDHRFYDIGAGSGFAALYACEAGFEGAAGCELPENEHLKCISDAAAGRLGLVDKVEIIYKPFSKVPENATVVFTFNAVFNELTQVLIATEVVRSNAKYLIYCKNPTYNNEARILEALEYKFETIKVVNASMQGSGARHTFFVLKRKD